MYKIVSLILVFAVLTAHSQDDNPGAQSIVLDDYSSPQTITGSINGATSSAAANCGAVCTDDVFFAFESLTKSAKFTLNSTDFDGVLEIWDAGLTSVTCINDADGVGAETILTNQLIPGNQYYVRIHSANGAYTSGNFSLEYRYLPLWDLRAAYRSTNINGDNYRIYDQMRRSNDSSIDIESSKWRVTNLVTSEVAEYVVPNNVSNNAYSLYLNQVEESFGTLADPFMCYGDSLSIEIEIRIEDMDCGFGPSYNVVLEEVPNTRLIDNHIGGLFNPASGQIRALKTHRDQVMDWEIYEFGELRTAVTTAVGERRLDLEFAFIIYNRAYEVRTRVTSCGETGPWSDLYPIFTSDIPYTSLQSNLCDISVSSETVLWCETVPLATGYFWQVTPINADDPSFTPIGPAQIVYTNYNLNLSQVVLAAGTAYRVGIKPVINFGEQEGDYGYFCQIGTPGSGVGYEQEETADDSSSSTFGTIIDFTQFNYSQASPTSKFSSNGLHIHSNPIEGALLDFHLDSPLGLVSRMQLINSDSQIVYEDVLDPNTKAASLRLDNLNAGVYFIVIISEEGIITEKFVKL